MGRSNPGWQHLRLVGLDFAIAHLSHDYLMYWGPNKGRIPMSNSLSIKA